MKYFMCNVGELKDLIIFKASKEAQDVEAVESARTTKGKSSDKQSSTKSSVGRGKNKNVKVSADRGEFLHLMAIVDVSALLYPGGM